MVQLAILCSFRLTIVKVRLKFGPNAHWDNVFYVHVSVWPKTGNEVAYLKR